LAQKTYDRVSQLAEHGNAPIARLVGEFGLPPQRPPLQNAVLRLNPALGFVLGFHQSRQPIPLRTINLIKLA
jgi:hypothetical protein